MRATTDWSKTVRVEVRGGDVVGHAGNVIPRMLADRTVNLSNPRAIFAVRLRDSPGRV